MEYLMVIEDFICLDLVCCCFYLKVCEKFSCECVCVGWCREVLIQLVKEWEWDDVCLVMFDNCVNWKIDQVCEVYNELFDVMMQSYCNLICFVCRNNFSVFVSLQDIGVLICKLYVVFEVLLGKVMLVNLQILFDFLELNLIFIYVLLGWVNCLGWYLYNCVLNIESIISYQLLEYNCYLNKLVVWVWFNGLLILCICLYIKGNGIVDLFKLQEMVVDVSYYFLLCLFVSMLKVFYSLCEICYLVIIVNLEYDLIVVFCNQVVYFDFCKLDVFSFGEN